MVWGWRLKVSVLRRVRLMWVVKFLNPSALPRRGFEECVGRFCQVVTACRGTRSGSRTSAANSSGSRRRPPPRSARRRPAGAELTMTNGPCRSDPVNGRRRASAGRSLGRSHLGVHLVDDVGSAGVDFRVAEVKAADAAHRGAVSRRGSNVGLSDEESLEGFSGCEVAERGSGAFVEFAADGA